MQRSGRLIANLAAALAKAQQGPNRPVNPEKSLGATIRQAGASAAERTLRHTPPSSWLAMR
jgi:hypothetical protein